MYKAIYATVRDLMDEGLPVALDQIREIGVNTVALAVSRPAGRLPWLRHQDAASASADGTVYFRARPERYGHIKPRLHADVAECDALAELQRTAPDLARAAWISGCQHAPHAERYADYVCRNAFGEPYLHHLCPAHPAVRDYVVNLCSDLGHGYDLAAVILETPGWLPYHQGWHRECATAPLERWAQTLLSWCFAETTCHAARAAGIDADHLRAQARQWLEQYFAVAGTAPAGMAAEWWFADLLSEPEWAAFLDWRCRLVVDLVIEVKAALPAGTALAVLPTMGAHAWRRLEGTDLAMLAAAADALEIPCYRPNPEDVRVDARAVRQDVGDDAALNFILRPAAADRADGARTVEAVLGLQQVGLAGLAFYDYGHVRMAGAGHLQAALHALERK